MTTESTKQALPLREAAIRWCDPALGSRYEEASNSHHLLRDMMARKRMPPPDHRYAQLSSMFFRSEIEIIQRAAHDAERALIADLRARVAEGEIVLSGWSTASGAELKQTTMPRELAAYVQFQLDHDTLYLHGVRYILVTAMLSLCQGVPDAQLDQTTSLLPVNMAPGDAIPGEAAPRRGGRKSAVPTIEAALRAHWRELFPNGAPEKPRGWSELERSLRRRVSRSGGHQPLSTLSEDTVRKHLPKIYAQILDGKEDERGSAQ